MNWRYAPGARGDVFNLVDWFDARQPGLGDDFYLELEAAIQRIVAQPRAYGRLSTAPRGRDVRIMMTHRFPVVVTYEVRPTEVVILSVTHARSVRRPWRLRLPDPPTS